MLSITYELVGKRRLMFSSNTRSIVSLNISIAYPLASDPGKKVQFILKYPVDISSGTILTSSTSHVSIHK